MNTLSKLRNGRVVQRMGFSEQIREALKRRGWSQRELAERLGVSIATASYWVNGQKEPDFAHRIDLAQVLGIPFEFIVPEMAATTARTITVAEKDLISIVDGARRLPPQVRRALTLSVQILVNTAELNSDTEQHSPTP